MPPISIKKRKALISQHPLFKTLPSNLIDELVNLTIEKIFAPGQIVVSQDDEDAIYFIAKGEVEVDREVKDKGFCLLIPQAILREGDTIGLNHVDLFGDTGIRTGTLKAISEGVLIGWDHNTFSTFLENNPSVHSSMRQASEILQRLNFIKQVEPFAKLPKERLSWLSTHIEEIHVIAGTILFKMREVGNECYLVRSGEVEISIPLRDGTQKKLATIVPPMLFGETALLTSSTRNADAKMTKTGKLLVINKEQLNELMQYHSTTESMMLLSVERCRPIRSDDIVHYNRKSDGGEEVVILKNKIHGKYFQLSEEGWFIWQHLDGTNTLQDLAVELFKFKRVFCPEAIADTIFKLSDAGFVQLPEVPVQLAEAPQENLTGWQQLGNSIRWALYIEFMFDNIDKKLTTSYLSCVKWIYTLMGRLLIGLTIISGAFLFGQSTPAAFNQLQSTQHLLLLVIFVFIANLLSVVIHELAHAYTTKYYSHEVRRGGIIFSWVSLIAFIDTSDMWLSDKRSKIMVSLSGPLADLTVAGLSGICAWMIPQKDVALFFWLLSLILYYGVFKNLNPYMENDGYYVMKDVYERPNLREASIRRLFRIGPPSVDSKNVEKEYLIICFLFMVIDVSIAFMIRHYLRLMLPDLVWGIPIKQFLLLFPIFVFGKYIVSTWVLVKRLKEIK